MPWDFDGYGTGFGCSRLPTIKQILSYVNHHSVRSLRKRQSAILSLVPDAVLAEKRLLLPQVYREEPALDDTGVKPNPSILHESRIMKPEEQPSRGRSKRPVRSVHTAAIEQLEARDLLNGDPYLVQDVNRGPTDFAELVVVGEAAYFSSLDSRNRPELWRTDGAADGTKLLRKWEIDVATLDTFSTVRQYFRFTPVGNTLLFAANDPATGRELWKTDGTVEGTQLVKDIRPGAESSLGLPSEFAVMQERLYFLTDGARGDVQLWKSDGTEAGTVLVKHIGSGSAARILVGKDLLYFYDYSANTLWRSDGTGDGTFVLQHGLRSLREPVVSGNTLFFESDDELWASDGTAEGTRSLDIRPGGGPSYPSHLIDIDGTLYFSTRIHPGDQIWKSDGTLVGTTRVATLSARVEGVMQHNGQLYFEVYDDQTQGLELWKSDGTSSGTVMVRVIRPPNVSSQWSFLEFAGSLNDTLFFTADDGIHGRELWRTDGTAEGTSLVKDIGPGIESGIVSEFKGFVVPLDSKGAVLATEDGDRFVFVADDGATGKELWASDGTSDGTQPVADLSGDAEAAGPQLLTAFRNKLLLVADQGDGFGLWQTNGLSTGTVRVTSLRLPTLDAAPGCDGGEYPSVSIGPAVFFHVRRGSLCPNEFWKSDGTVEGTRLIADTGASGYATPTNVKGTLFSALGTSTVANYGRLTERKRGH